jgi:hypothetical protein
MSALQRQAPGDRARYEAWSFERFAVAAEDRARHACPRLSQAVSEPEEALPLSPEESRRRSAGPPQAGGHVITPLCDAPEPGGRDGRAHQGGSSRATSGGLGPEMAAQRFCASASAPLWSHGVTEYGIACGCRDVPRSREAKGGDAHPHLVARATCPGRAFSDASLTLAVPTTPLSRRCVLRAAV